MVKTTLATTLFCGVLAISCTDTDLDSSFSDGAEFRFENGVLHAQIPELVFQSDRSVERTIAVDTAIALRQKGDVEGEGFIGKLVLGTEHSLEFQANNHRQWRSGYATLDSTAAALRDASDTEPPPLRDRGLTELKADQVQRQTSMQLPEGLEACSAPSVLIAVQLTSFDFGRVNREAAVMALTDPEMETALFRDPIEEPGALGTAQLEQATGAHVRAIVRCPSETLIAEFSGLVQKGS